jgi:ribonuclease HI
MCAIHVACDLIESKPMGAYIILTDSLASIEGLKSSGLSYRTNDMLFRTKTSLRYLGDLVYDITLMWIPSHVSIQGNDRADVLANEGSTSGTLYQDQTGLTTVDASDIHTRTGTKLLIKWQEFHLSDSEMGLIAIR